MKAITGTLFSLLGTVRWIILHEHEKKARKRILLQRHQLFRQLYVFVNEEPPVTPSRVDLSQLNGFFK